MRYYITTLVLSLLLSGCGIEAKTAKTVKHIQAEANDVYSSSVDRNFQLEASDGSIASYKTAYNLHDYISGVKIGERDPKVGDTVITYWHTNNTATKRQE